MRLHFVPCQANNRRYISHLVEKDDANATVIEYPADALPDDRIVFGVIEGDRTGYIAGCTTDETLCGLFATAAQARAAITRHDEYGVMPLKVYASHCAKAVASQDGYLADLQRALAIRNFDYAERYRKNQPEPSAP